MADRRDTHGPNRFSAVLARIKGKTGVLQRYRGGRFVLTAVVQPVISLRAASDPEPKFGIWDFWSYSRVRAGFFDGR